MNSNKTILMIIGAGLIFQSCHKGSIWGIRGEGQNITESRTLGNFNAIDLSIDADIIYTQDSVYSLVVSGQKNILNILETKVIGNELKMDFRRNVWRYTTLNLIIHAPDMNRITISGNGDVNVSNKISGNSLDLTISGSGNISIPALNLQSLNARISGSGSVNIYDGICKSEYFNISASGNINSEFFKAENADVKISGSGDVVLNASATLKVDISGSGNVKYRGHPTIKSHISGFGELIQLD